MKTIKDMSAHSRQRKFMELAIEVMRQSVYEPRSDGKASPKVARKGIQHLENSGIEVAMFDRDLQEIIEKENADFLKQANERASAAKKAPARIKADVGSSEFNRLLPAIIPAVMAGYASRKRQKTSIRPKIRPFWPDRLNCLLPNRASRILSRNHCAISLISSL
ncbi:MAG: hypothetical protein ACOYOU_04155 [Kiritimatiellia bacterium]